MLDEKSSRMELKKFWFFACFMFPEKELHMKENFDIFAEELLLIKPEKRETRWRKENVLAN